MATSTINPTANTTPDAGQGGLAVSSPSNTGHGSTTSTASGGTSSQTKTCIWTFSIAGPASPTAVVLKVDFSRSGTSTDGFVLTANSFTIEYSLNSGSNWNTLRSNSNFTTLATGTDQVVLATSQNLTHVRVRSKLVATKEELTTATANATISNIRLEANTADAVARKVPVITML